MTYNYTETHGYCNWNRDTLQFSTPTVYSCGIDSGTVREVKEQKQPVPALSDCTSFRQRRDSQIL
jgi:hypothetical protein